MTSRPVKEWSRLIGSSFEDRAIATSIAEDGSIFVLLSSAGNLDSDKPAGLGSNSFVCKFNADGSKAWTKAVSDSANAISLDNEGYIYIAGSSEVKSDRQLPNGTTDSFVAKYNSNGVKIWSQNSGLDGFDTAKTLGTAIDKSVYIAGYRVGNRNGVKDTEIEDAFLSKYKNNGAKAWTHVISSSSGDTRAYSLSTSFDGSVYIAGSAEGKALDGQQLKKNSASPYITKYKSDGSRVWTSIVRISGFGYAESITSTIDNFIYLIGPNHHSKTAKWDYFLSKYDSTGANSWTRSLGLTSFAYGSISTASDGSIYVAGWTNTDVDGTKHNGGLTDAVLLKYNENGDRIWSQLIGTSFTDTAAAISASGDNLIYLTGSTSGDFDGLTNNGESDVFIVKYNNKPVPSYSFIVSPKDANEGDVIFTSILTSGIPIGAKLFYNFSGFNINASDFTLGTLSDSLTVDAEGKVTFAFEIASDLATEGPEILDFALYSDSAKTSEVLSAAIVISDTSITPIPLYKIQSSNSFVDEGGTLSFDITSSNVPRGTILYYKLQGAGINPTDFVSERLSGSISLSSDGSSTFSQGIVNDLTLEGQEVIDFRLYSDSHYSNQILSAEVTINDTSLPIVTTSLPDRSDPLLNSEVEDQSFLVDNVSPRLVDAFLHKGKLFLEFDEIISPVNISPFRVKLIQDNRRVPIRRGYSYSEDSIAVFPLEKPRKSSASLSVSYFDLPGDQRANVIQDLHGNDLASFSDFNVAILN